MRSSPPFLVAFVGWLLPGAGYWLIGQTARGLVVGAAILILFFSGILIAGVRMIDVPGWDDHGEKAMIGRSDHWALTGNFTGAVVDKPWYVGQILAGPVTLIASKVSIDAGQGANPYPKTKARIGEIGTLYTAIAGMLNLLAIIDAGHRAASESNRLMHPYTPFFTPLPIWDYWWALLFPLVICISVAYKGIKCETMRQVPVQAASITFWILISLAAAAAGLSILVKILER